MNRMVALLTLLFALFVGVTGLVSAETHSSTLSPARYRITFDANWSATNHPDAGFPVGSAHWSPMAGMLHNSSVTVWENGGMASAGVERVAETGGTGTLMDEYTAALNAGNANAWLIDGFSPFSGVSTASVEVTATTDFPLLSVVSMIAPSPDWFAGVSSLSLLDDTGNWKSTIAVPLYPYDAGTEEGTEYRGDNPATLPQEPISSLRNVAPFSDETVGLLTVTLLSTPTAVALNGAQADTSGGTWLLFGAMLGLLVLTVGRSRVGTR